MDKLELQYICEIIRSSVSAQDVGRALGLTFGHDGRCKCFFHGGDHKNLKLYPEPGRGYYCFQCHVYGDVIRLVMGYTQCSFMEAVEWLNDSFGLNLNINNNSTYARTRRAIANAKKYAKEMEHAKDAEPTR